MSLNKVLGVLLMSYLTNGPANACMHFPVSYKKTMKEGKKEALIFHDGKDAHLIIRTQLDAEKFPDEVAWVLPFPSLPSKYEEVDGKLFEELFQFLPDQIAAASRTKAADSLSLQTSEGIIFHKTIDLEHYVIQPIEITSEDAGNEFNTWLTKNNFNSMPMNIQKYYLKKGAVFLAVRMKTSGLSKIIIKPLHIVYSSTQVSVPIKFSHNERTFDVDLYVFSRSNLSKKIMKNRNYFQSLENSFFNIATSSKPYEKSTLPNLAKILGNTSGFIQRYSVTGLNTYGKIIRNIATDPGFSSAVLNER